jgi:hypothetical protein
MPRVFESHYLRIGFESALVFEKHVVIAVAIERRVEIDKIDGFFVDIPSKNILIVAVIESVHAQAKCSIIREARTTFAFFVGFALNVWPQEFSFWSTSGKNKGLAVVGTSTGPFCAEKALSGSGEASTSWVN